MALAWLVVMAAPTRAWAGQLDGVRSAVRNSGSSAFHLGSSSSPGYSSGSLGYSSWGSSWSYGTASGATCCGGPTGLSQVQGVDGRRTMPMFGRYPYERAHEDGYVRKVPVEDTDLESNTAKMWSLQVAAEGSYLGHKLFRTGLYTRFSYWRLGLDNDVSFFLQQPFKDALYLGTANLTFAPVMRPKLIWRVGIGLNYMIDGRTPGKGRRDYAAGGNVSTSLDAFPVKPLVLSAQLDAGSLYKAPTFRARGTVGVIFHKVEFYAGYEYRRIANVTLQGPQVGVRMWF